MSVTLVLLNPHAAGGKAAVLAEPIRRWLTQHAAPVQLAMPDTAAQSRHVIDALPPNSRVIVVGGDGTLNQLLPSLLAGAHTVALVPKGSGNDTARSLGLYGLSWQEALHHGLHGQVSSVDVGLAELKIEASVDSKQLSVPFISSFTTGFDSSVGLRALLGPSWLRGLPRYLLATLHELLSFRTWQLQVSLDGVPVYAGAALFASSLNTRTFGAGMPAVPHASMNDGKLDLLLAKNLTVLQTLWMLPRLLLGKHLSHSQVHTQAFETMRISAKTPIPLAADGEYLGESRQIDIKVLAAKLAVVRVTG